MKKINKFLISSGLPIRMAYLCVIIWMSAFIGGCSGGNSELVESGGIGGTGISVGEISALGSVVVNDVHFDTQKTELLFNGESAGSGDTTIQNRLALGMVVRVEGEILDDGTGTAERIIFNHSVKGPVTHIAVSDDAALKIQVLGQDVVIDTRTRLPNTLFSTIKVGQVVQISGWNDGTGAIQATYLEDISDIVEPDEEMAVKGSITSINQQQKRFKIKYLTVDFSDLASVVPLEGRWVNVRGFLTEDGILNASWISFEDELGTDNADEVDIQGVVTRIISSDRFFLGQTAVQIDSATSFKGLESVEIEVGTRLFIKGTLNNGTILADEVTANDKVNIKALVSDVDLVTRSLLLKGLDEIVVNVSNVTRVFGDAKDLSEIEKDAYVYIYGHTSGDNSIDANQIKVSRNQSNRVKLHGPITAIQSPLIYILGIEIDLSQISAEGFEDHGDEDEDEQNGNSGKEDDEDDNGNNHHGNPAIGDETFDDRGLEMAGRVDKADNEEEIDQFVDKISVGDIVNVEGELHGNQIIWKEVEFVDDD